MRPILVLCLVAFLGLSEALAQVIVVPRPPVPPRPPRVVVVPPNPHVYHRPRQVHVYHERHDAQRQRERARYERQRALEREAERARRERERNAYDRFSLHLGASANYTYGLLGEGFSGYDNSLTDWQVNGFLGYRFDVTGKRKRRKGNLIGVWGTIGMHDQTALNSLFTSQNRVDLADPNQFHEFREMEVGILFKEWFRLSTGVGYQNFTNLGGENITLNYYSTTAGIAMRLTKAFDLTANGTVIYGKDFEQYAFRPSVGLNYTFDFLRR